MTLGIPRLRELLMTAAQSIKTPVMTLPLWPHCSRDDAQALANRLRRLHLAEVLIYSFETCFAIAKPASLQPALFGMSSVFYSKLLSIR